MGFNCGPNEVTKCADLVQYGSEQVIREKGFLRIAGKEYNLEDGDVVYFRFAV